MPPASPDLSPRFHVTCGRYTVTLSSATLLFAVCSAHAQPRVADAAYPAKPVRVVVGLAPGGATDVQARLFSRRISEELGRPFVVDNRSGAGGLIGFQTVATAAPDGYTLLAGTPSVTIAPAFHDKPPYDPVKDFAPISLVSKAPFLIVVHPSFAAKSMSEMIAYARANPGKLLLGTGGLGTPVHLGLVWIANASNIKVTIVPYKGTGPVLVDLLAGQVHATFANPINVTGHVKAGRLRALATTGAERTRVMPELPTVAESGVRDFEVTTWHGWLAPAHTPPGIINRLGTLLARYVQAPDVAEKMAEDGGEPVGSTPAVFRAFIADETARWRKLVKETGIQAGQ